jgi:hypothetical protein
MPGFADVFSEVRQRTFDRLAGRSTASTDIVVAPTDHENSYYGKMSQLQAQTEKYSQQTNFYTPVQNTLFAPAEPMPWHQSVLNEIAEQANQGMSLEYAYSYWYNNNTRSYPPLGQGVYGLNGDTATETLAPVLEVVEPPSREMLTRVPVDIENLDLTDPRQRLATEAEALLGYTPLRQELRTPGTLKRVLAKLEISVLEEKSVFAYKKQMAKHYSTSGKMLDPTWRITSLKDYGQQVPEFVLQKAVEIKRELPEAMFYVEQLAIDPFLIVTLKPLNDYVSSSHTLKRVLDAETAAYVEVWSEPKFEATM